MIRLLLALALAVPFAAPHAASAAAPDRRPTVAVLYFDYDGPDAAMGTLRKGLAQMLITDLSAIDQVRLVERARLQDVLEEQELHQKMKVDPATATRIGKLLGARYLVLGAYFDLMGTLRIDTRLVDVETSRVVHATGAQGKPETFLDVQKKVADAVAKALREALPPLADPPEKPKSNKKSRKAPKRPKKLTTKTAARYGKALDAVDRGDDDSAKAELKKVLEEAPDFELAAFDLDRLMQ